MPAMQNFFFLYLVTIFWGIGVIVFAQENELTLESDDPLEFDEASGELVATGGGVLRYGEGELSADLIRYQQDTGKATAEGNVVMFYQGVRALAERAVYEAASGSVSLENVRMGDYPIYLSAARAEGGVGEWVMEDVPLLFGAG